MAYKERMPIQKKHPIDIMLPVLVDESDDKMSTCMPEYGPGAHTPPMKVCHYNIPNSTRANTHRTLLARVKQQQVKVWYLYDKADKIWERIDIFAK